MKIDWNSVDSTPLTEEQYLRLNTAGDRFNEDLICAELMTRLKVFELKNLDAYLLLINEISQTIFENNYIEVDNATELRENDEVIIFQCIGQTELEVSTGKVIWVMRNQQNLTDYTITLSDPHRHIKEKQYPILIFRSSPTSERVIKEFYKPGNIFQRFKPRHNWKKFRKRNYPDVPPEPPKNNSYDSPYGLIPES